MNHSTELLRELTLPEMAEIYQNYMIEAFPEDELKPMKRIEEMYHAGIYRGYGLFDDAHTLLAYGYFVEDPSSRVQLLDYLAVPADKRGQGHGSRFLSHLPEMTNGAHVLLFEIEHPEKTDDPGIKAEREARKRFYLGNGIAATDVEACVFGVEYQILQYRSGTPLSRAEVYTALDQVYHAMFPERWFGTYVTIHQENDHKRIVDAAMY